MLRLATLDGLTLADPAGNPLVTQRPRLALLALLGPHPDLGTLRVIKPPGFLEHPGDPEPQGPTLGILPYRGLQVGHSSSPALLVRLRTPDPSAFIT